MPRLIRTLTAAGVALLVTTGNAGASPLRAKHERTLTARHAILRVPVDRVTRTLSPVQGCQVLLDTGDGDCVVVETAKGQLVVTAEPGPPVEEGLVSRPWIVRVYEPSADIPDGWVIALSTRPAGADPGPLYANVTVFAADVTGDGADEVLFGYRSEGTGQILDVDIVGTGRDGAPLVLAHDQLYKGSLLARHGRIVTYTPVYRANDPNCCPTWIERDTIRFRNGAFRVQAGPRTPTARANQPPGDLG